MKRLLNILRYKRPYGGAGDEKLIAEILDVIPNMKADSFGNRMLTIGDKPNVLFSSHTDTVHNTDGLQIVLEDKKKKVLYKDDGECLGADDGAGIWVMLNLIEAKVPGLYIFHRGEECGGLGSSYIAHDTPEVLDDITIAIAFDRRGTKDIITSQSGGKCASQEFCDSLAEQLDADYSSARGSFTDTANYTDLVEECTNISVGYYEEHRKTESLDYEYLFILLDKMVNLNYSKLVVAREKGDSGYTKYDWNAYTPKYYNDEDDENIYAGYSHLSYKDVTSFVVNNPALAANMLYDSGLSQADIDLEKTNAYSTF